MKLVSTTLLSFVSTSIKMLAALVINKTVAIYTGPGGIALIGQLQDSMRIANTFAQGGINSGVTKYTAEFAQESNSIGRLWSTSARVTVFCSIIVGLILILFSNIISEAALKDTNYSYILAIFGLTIVLFSLNQLLISILNGLKEIKTLTLISVVQSIYALIFTSVMIIFYGIDGALIGLVTNQSIVFLFAVFKLKKHAIIKLAAFREKFSPTIFRKLLLYSAMALVTALFVPASYLIIRNYIGTSISWEHAGYWQSMVYISSMYLMVISTALTTYYLPRLSEISDKNSLRDELKSGYLIIIPVVIVLSLTVYSMRDFIVNILFSADFQEVTHLFKWQLIGDVLKVASFLMSFLMLAKAMTKQYILTEVFFSIFFTTLAVFFIQSDGAKGVTYAYALTNAVYFCVMTIITKKIWY